MEATGSGAVRRGDRAAETAVYISSTVRGDVKVTGAAVLDATVINPDGSRLAYVAPTGDSGYGVTVGSPSTTFPCAATKPCSP